MTNCCRKCAKLLCKERNTKEDCKECISYVLLAMRKINKKLEDNYETRI